MLAKIVNGSRARRLGNLSAAVITHKDPVISALLPHMFTGENEELIPGVGTPVSVQGFKPNLNKDHVFEMMRVRNMEGSVQEFSNVENNDSANIALRLESDCYQPVSNVNLYCVMQTNVPEPYSNGRPTHFNMPGGNVKLEQKYFSNKLNLNHPSRGYHTYLSSGTRDKGTLQRYGLCSAAQSRKYGTALKFKDFRNVRDVDIPKSIKLEDEERFLAWLDKGRRYGLDWSRQYDSLVSKEKLLEEVIAEQNAAIASITQDYESNITGDSYSYQGIQGDITPQAWLKNHTVASLQKDEFRSIEGVQGLNCEHFKVWLNNCSKYGFLNCDNQLTDVKDGRKTLADIFKEQELVIKQVTEDYQTIHGVGTVDPKQSQTENSKEVTDLSQGAKLKRAVQQYGSTVVVFHVTISLISLGGFYLAVSSGVDMVGFLKTIGISQSYLESNIAAGMSTFVVAYAVHKVFAPVRIATTLTCTPLIVRRLRKIGWLKTPKPIKK